MYQIDTVDFNLDYTLSCGQVFRWEKNDWWTGVVGGAVVRARQEGNELIISSTLEKKAISDYFRLDDDMGKIYASINKDEKIAALIRKYRGLRLIRQDPWECLISYTCSKASNIPKIKNSIKRMCECFGREIETGYYSFPTPEALAKVQPCVIKEQCRVGFRAPDVRNIASMIAKREFDLYSIKELSYEQGREDLKKIKGVGNKIADCVLLFAFDKLESFPVDIHIERIMERFYAGNFGSGSKKKENIAEFARNYFGKYCGYAQQYLYFEDFNKVSR